MRISDTLSKYLEETVNEYKDNPVNLLQRHNYTGEGEYRYLQNSLPSYRETVADIINYFNGNTAFHLLEIGTFLGLVAIVMKKMGFDIEATDIPEFAGDDSTLKKRLDNHGIPLSAANLRHATLPYPDNNFDGIIMCEVLEHFNFNPLPTLREINRILKQGGLLYLTTPNIASLRNRLNLLIGKSIHNNIDDFFAQFNPNNNMIVGLHWREYTKDEIRYMLEKMNFTIMKQSLCYHHRLQSVKGLVVNIAYSIIPSLRPNIVTVATKVSDYKMAFTYTDATNPKNQ